MYILILALGTVSGQENVSTRLHFAFIEATGPRKPFVLEGKVIFTYQQEEPARFVSAAFSYEDFTVMHPYKRYTPEGGSEIFVLAVTPPPFVDTLIYRVVVDGLWMSDPANPDTVVDVHGIPLSRFRVPEEGTTKTYPLIDTNGKVTFVYTSRPNQQVSVAGTFNSWDPFMYPMREVEAGRYERTLYLAPGEYVYHFVVNGTPIHDPGNPSERYDQRGNRFSYFAVKPEEDPDMPTAEKKRLIDRIPFIGGS